jgi:hypothetical protein
MAAKITVLGRGISPDTKKMFEEATMYFASVLMSTRMVNTLNIRLELRKTTLAKEQAGVAYRDTKGSFSQKKHQIVIRYKEGATTDMLTTLAHEMFHVKQFALNELQLRYWKTDRKLHARWKGAEMGAVDEISYIKRPWEIEAYANQDALYRKYIRTKLS